MREAVLAVPREPARQQAAQLPDDVRHPLGHDLGRRPVGDRRGLPRGNEKVLRELGKNIGIVWGGRTSMQAGGERAGRQIFLTLDDARAHRRRVVAGRGRQPRARARRRHGEERATTPRRCGVTASSRSIRTSAPSSSSTAGSFTLARRGAGARASRSSAPTWPSSCSASATSSARRSRSTACPTPSSARSGRRTRTATTAVPTTTRSSCRSRRWRSDLPRTRRRARRAVGHHRRAEAVGRRRAAARARRRGRAASRTSTGRSSRTSARSWRAATASIPTTSEAIAMWDTSLETLMFGRMIGHMKRVLHHRRHRDAGARRHRRDEHHAGRGEGADARDRRPQGARRDDRAASSGSSSSRASSSRC